MKPSENSSLLEKNLDELKEIQSARALNKRDSYYLDTRPLRRELYPQHIGFFTAGADYRERYEISGGKKPIRVESDPGREKLADDTLKALIDFGEQLRRTQDDRGGESPQ